MNNEPGECDDQRRAIEAHIRGVLRSQSRATLSDIFSDRKPANAEPLAPGALLERLLEMRRNYKGEEA